MSGRANLTGQRGGQGTAIAPIGASRARSRSPLQMPGMTSPRHKRPLTALDSVELGDRATTAMEEHIEQDYQGATNPTRRAQHAEAWTGDSKPGNLVQNKLESTSTETAITSQVSSDIPEWVLAESEAMSREVTPPTQYFFRTAGRDKMATAARRRSSGLYTTYTARGVSSIRHWHRS